MGRHRVLGVLLCVCLVGPAACGNGSEEPGPGPDPGGDIYPPVQTDLFVGGDGGYHTYRIPALVTTQAGTLLAFCEGRKHSPADHGDIDLLLRRSFDRGATWGPVQVVWEDGTHTIGNPAPVVDRDTGVIWLGFCRDNSRVYMTSSRDEGAAWAAPTEITGEVKPQGWGWYATGPGHGIQLSSGRLLIPCDHSSDGSTFSHAIFSDDHGRTWILGGDASAGTDESMAVERPDGSVHLTMRSSLFGKTRAFCVSTDRGETWSPAEPAEPLTDPVCQASILGVPAARAGEPQRTLFLNPASVFRVNLTMRVSYDGAVTWPVERMIQKGPSAYSDMAPLPGGEVAALYEAGSVRLYERILFARIRLSWVEQGENPLSESP